MTAGVNGGGVGRRLPPPEQPNTAIATTAAASPNPKRRQRIGALPNGIAAVEAIADFSRAAFNKGRSDAVSLPLDGGGG